MLLPDPIPAFRPDPSRASQPEPALSDRPGPALSMRPGPIPAFRPDPAPAKRPVDSSGVMRGDALRPGPSAARLPDPAAAKLPPRPGSAPTTLETTKGQYMVSFVNSHSNAISKRWHLWEIDSRFALNSTPGWLGVFHDSGRERQMRVNQQRFGRPRRGLSSCLAGQLHTRARVSII
jgi:hypothetical protein